MLLFDDNDLEAQTGIKKEEDDTYLSDLHTGSDTDQPSGKVSSNNKELEENVAIL